MTRCRQVFSGAPSAFRTILRWRSNSISSLGPARASRGSSFWFAAQGDGLAPDRPCAQRRAHPIEDLAVVDMSIASRRGSRIHHGHDMRTGHPCHFGANDPNSGMISLPGPRPCCCTLTVNADTIRAPFAIGRTRIGGSAVAAGRPADADSRVNLSSRRDGTWTGWSAGAHFHSARVIPAIRVEEPRQAIRNGKVSRRGSKAPAPPVLRIAR